MMAVVPFRKEPPWMGRVRSCSKGLASELWPSCREATAGFFYFSLMRVQTPPVSHFWQKKV